MFREGEREEDDGFPPPSLPKRFAPMELASSKEVGGSTLHRFGIRPVLLGSRLNVLMLLTPLAIMADSAKWSDAVTFSLSLLSIAPFAERLGYITEQLAMHTNETLGGLLNATFGNATELIISLFALLKSRGGDEERMFLRLVKVSLLGSMLSNLLLVFGSALVVGGLKHHPEQKFIRMGASMSTVLLTLSLLACSSGLFLGSDKPNDVLLFSRITSFVLIVVYIFFLMFQLRTHRHVYESEGSKDNKHNDQKGFQPIATKATEIELGNNQENSSLDSMDSAESEDEVELEFWTCVVWLGIISVFISVLSEYLVGAIKGTSDTWGLSSEFIGAILIPVVGNAAEHASAVIFAYKNKLDITLGVALGSATQIGIFVLPFCVVIGWVFGIPLNLLFQPFELLSLLATVLLVAFIVREGETNWLHGVLALAAYFIIATGFGFS